MKRALLAAVLAMGTVAGVVMHSTSTSVEGQGSTLARTASVVASRTEEYVKADTTISDEERAASERKVEALRYLAGRHRSSRALIVETVLAAVSLHDSYVCKDMELTIEDRSRMLDQSWSLIEVIKTL